ncbi:hypothetical protein ACN20G_22520 [Streptomyces sp. BI20]|uniref:hypothetical protein n=1 Tax=Streptomyces sp. BI20 TaxID=3403460 RepID=UPI003C7832D4
MPRTTPAPPAPDAAPDLPAPRPDGDGPPAPDGSAAPQAPPAPAPRGPGRVLAATLCALTGAGLLVGAGVTKWTEHREAERPRGAAESYRAGAELWHEAPVDALLPPVVAAPDAGLGGADRTWTRVALVPDADCPAALSPGWTTALARAGGCERVLRASYTDATRSFVITVGLVFTPGDDAGALAALPGNLPIPPGLGFADEQRATWTVTAVPEAPVLVYTVSAHTDGRTVNRPRPAPQAGRESASPEDAEAPDTSALAQSGLGHDSRALADRITRAVRLLATTTPEPASESESAPTPEQSR